MIELGFFIVFLACGFIFGQRAEKRHFESIIKREKQTISLPVVASKYPPEDQLYDQVLVSGNVVVASDYFKSFTAGLINIFGGRVTPFESLLDRGRREAVLRMKDDAISHNADWVFNIKFETSRIVTGRAGAIEVLAYGTALVPERTSVASSDTSTADNLVTSPAISATRTTPAT